MINEKRFPKLNKLQEKNMWFVHIYKGGGLSLYKSVNISTDEISENEFKCMGELTPDEKFFRLEIKDNKIIFKSDAKKKSMFNYSVCIRDEKGNIITDILTKEILEEAITNNTIVLDSKEVQALIDADCTLEKFFETNKKNTFWFL